MKDYSKIDREINKLKILYDNIEGCCISFVVTDNCEIRKYIENKITEKDFILDEKIEKYDFFENRDINLEEYTKICKQKESVVLVTGCEDYAEYLKKNGKITENGQFYMNTFNLPRDGFYLKNNVRIIFLLNQKEYSRFLSDSADDFTAYSMLKCDIDNLLKSKNEFAYEER